MTPSYIPILPGELRSHDYYEREMLKYKGRCGFIDLSHLYAAVLAEADTSVMSYIPRPFSIRAGKLCMFPALYRVTSGHREVVFITLKSKLETYPQDDLTGFFSLHGLSTIFEDKQNYLNREVEAENWLSILGLLVTSEYITTEQEENVLLDLIYAVNERQLGELVCAGNRVGDIKKEIALFRLLHRGLIGADLTSTHIDFSTRVYLRKS